MVGTIYIAIIEVDTEARGGKTKTAWSNMGDGRRYNALVGVEPVGKSASRARQMQVSAFRDLLDRRLNFLDVQCGYLFEAAVRDNRGELPDLLIVTAPEFLLAKQEASVLAKPPVDEFCYTEADKEYIRARVARMSDDRPGLLLVPGSIFWYKASQRPPVASEAWATDAQRAAKRAKKAGTVRNLDDRYINKASIETSRFWPPRPVISSDAKAFSLLFGDQDDVRKDVEFQVLHYAAKTDPNDRKWVKNTAFFSYNGSILATYDKKFPDGSEMGSETIIFIPGNRPGVVDVPSPRGSSYRVGIEICRDNMSGALVTGGVANLDVQLVLSAYIDGVAPEATAVRDGGVLANADSRNGGRVFQVGRTAKTVKLAEVEAAPALGLYSSFGPTRVFKTAV